LSPRLLDVPALGAYLGGLSSDTARELDELGDVAKRVYVAGSGPAVIVMTEMPSISPVGRALCPVGCGMPGSRSTCRRSRP
jgi:hypothetical protein